MSPPVADQATGVNTAGATDCVADPAAVGPLPDLLDYGELLRLRPTSPDRRPDWAWRLGSLLADAGDRKRSWPQAVIRVRRFVRAGLTGRNPRRRDPALAEAADFHTVASPGEATYFETLVIAGLGRDEIASLAGLSPEAVTAYEAAFCDLRGRPSYVARNLLRLHQPGGPFPDDPRVPAFLLGRAGLAATAPHTRSGDSSADAASCLDALARRDAAVRKLLAVQALPVSSPRDVKLAVRLYELDRRLAARRNAAKAV